MTTRIIVGDCRDVLRTLPEASIDSIVTDPPYGLAFMGKKWDYDVPSEEIWRECLRVLKPGGHLLAFAGTRTQHRMAVRIEDAGFEIRDMIAWVYGSGFPKSMDVSKAIDKAAGAERTERLAPKAGHEDFVGRDNMKALRESGVLSGEGGFSRPWMNDPQKVENAHWHFAPATPEAERWNGWGTALKPALETVTFASKPYTDEQVRDIIQSNLFRLEARLWLLSSANAAGKSSTSNQSEYGAACAIAQWSADEITNTRAALCDPMGTSLFELATNTSLNIVSSWRRILAESWSDGSTSTIETRSSTTIDWRTLKFSLSQITPASIIKACSLPGGFSANASTAESHFNASLSLLQSILTLSATELAISQAQHEHLGAGVKPNLDPCIMARKPLAGTVAENVLAHGTGALNIDGCRITVGDDAYARNHSGDRGHAGTRDASGEGATNLHPGGGSASTLGRWPANLIHDGSEEVVALFPSEAGAAAPVHKRNGDKFRTAYGSFAGNLDEQGSTFHGDTGSAARFFYCAKADKDDRGEGNTHPTVKPGDLMRYLIRMVTPPGGTVLDPFMGSGSTLLAADREGFNAIGVELNPEYAEMARRRLYRDAPLFAEVE